MKLPLLLVSFIGVVGFCINAALAVCKRQHGDLVKAEDAAYQGIACLIVAVIAGLTAWGM